MKQDDEDSLKRDKKSNKENGEEDMAVMERELREMQKLQEKRTLTREQLRKALIKETIKNNYTALERLSRT